MMIRKLWSRGALIILGLGLMGAGAVGGVRQEPLVINGKGGVVLAPIPLWAAACLAVGLLVVLVVAPARGLRGSAARSVPLLVVLWVLQFMGGAGVYRWPTQTPPNSSWLTRYASISATWWGIAVLAVTVIGAVVWSVKRE